MDRIQEYYRQSLLANLCGEYKGRWAACHGDKEKLLKLSLCQQSIPHVVTFAYEGNGLTKDYVTEEFKDFINGYVVRDADGVDGYTYGLYADYNYDNDLEVNVDVCSIMWTVGASVVVKATKCPVIYVSNRSKVHLVCEGYNNVRVYLFDKSDITLEDVDENSSVIVYKYSSDANIEVGKYCLSKNVKVFEKQLKL